MGLLSRAAASDSLEGQINRYHRSYASFHCILLDSPDRPEEEEEEGAFYQKAAKMIYKTGTLFLLPKSRPLVLLPGDTDRELIAHRLSKTLNTSALLSFQADSPEGALNRINSLQ